MISHQVGNKLSWDKRHNRKLFFQLKHYQIMRRLILFCAGVDKLILTWILCFAVSEWQIAINCYLKSEDKQKHDRTFSRADGRSTQPDNHPSAMLDRHAHLRVSMLETLVATIRPVSAHAGDVFITQRVCFVWRDGEGLCSFLGSRGPQCVYITLRRLCISLHCREQ